MASGGARQLLASAVCSILTAALAGVALAWMANDALGLDERYLPRTVALLCAGGLLLLWRIVEHHPYQRVGPANQVTIARAVLVVLLAGLVGLSAPPRLHVAALAAATLAVVLDAVDGWLARRTRMSSAYGARFDMETDALLILVLSLLAWEFDKAGPWVIASGLARYVFLAASQVFRWMQRPLFPSRRRKAVAVLQVVALLVAVAAFVPRDVSSPLCAAALAVLAWSFALDVAWLRHRACDARAVR